jgi:hypothetical protein
MAGNRLEALEKLFKQRQDSALLRFGVGRAYFNPAIPPPGNITPRFWCRPAGSRRRP